LANLGTLSDVGVPAMSALGQKQTFVPLYRADRRLIFCLEIALNQVGNFQIVAFGSLA
jgi:hypothetical protein